MDSDADELQRTSHSRDPTVLGSLPGVEKRWDRGKAIRTDAGAELATTDELTVVLADELNGSDLKGALAAAEIDELLVGWVEGWTEGSVRCTGTTALATTVLSSPEPVELDKEATRSSIGLEFELSAGDCARDWGRALALGNSTEDALSEGRMTLSRIVSSGTSSDTHEISTRGSGFKSRNAESSTWRLKSLDGGVLSTFPRLTLGSPRSRISESAKLLLARVFRRLVIRSTT